MVSSIIIVAEWNLKYLINFHYASGRVLYGLTLNGELNLCIQRDSKIVYNKLILSYKYPKWSKMYT